MSNRLRLEPMGMRPSGSKEGPTGDLMIAGRLWIVEAGSIEDADQDGDGATIDAPPKKAK